MLSDSTKPDPARVQALRDEYGLYTARRMADLERIEAAIAQAQTVDDLKPILRRLVKGMHNP